MARTLADLVQPFQGWTLLRAWPDLDGRTVLYLKSEGGDVVAVFTGADVVIPVPRLSTLDASTLWDWHKAEAL